jgi:hypothetical protein
LQIGACVQGRVEPEFHELLQVHQALLAEHRKVLAGQRAVHEQQDYVLAQARAALEAHHVEKLRSEPVWWPEPEVDAKRSCLRNTFLNGTEGVGQKVYSQGSEDGVIDAMFRCIGHRNKCAQCRHGARSATLLAPLTSSSVHKCALLSGRLDLQTWSDSSSRAS